MMSRSYGVMGVGIGILWLVLLPGCSTTAPPYQVGDVERIRFTYEENHWQWVEMPDKPPTKKDGRVITKEIVMRREVESVNPNDNSALMNVTLEKVDINMKTVLSEKTRYSYYRSSAEETNSNIPELPKLAGTSYKIRMAPDTTVLEIIGLDELCKQLEIKEDNFLLAPEVDVLTPKAVKQLQERECRQCGVKPGKTVKKLTHVPHMMIKAQAMNTTYTADRGRMDGDAKWITVTSAGEEVHTLPEGWDAPPDPTDGRLWIKNMFDMQKLDVTGKGEWDANTGRVKSEQKHISCLLVYLGSKIASLNPQRLQNEGKDAGEILAEISVKQTFEALP